MRFFILFFTIIFFYVSIQSILTLTYVIIYVKKYGVTKFCKKLAMLCGFYRSLAKVTIEIFFILINTAIKYLLAIKQA